MSKKQGRWGGTAMVSFRTGDLDMDIRARAGENIGLHMVAKRDLYRWYSLMRATMREARLTRAELATGVSVLEDRPEPARRTDVGWWKALMVSRLVPLAHGGDVDARSLLTKLDGGSHALVWALVDAAERHFEYPDEWPIDALAAEAEIR